MTSIDLSRYLPADPAQATRAAVTPVCASMQGSMILRIAGEVNALAAAGHPVSNFTVGDFRPAAFPVPAALVEATSRLLREGQTNYPPSDGVPELKRAIVQLVDRYWGLQITEDWVCVASGARPPIYAAWRMVVAPGERSVSFLPMWNTGYYSHLTEADHVFVPTQAENNFFPTVAQAREAMKGARLVVLNSPLNPTGTMIDPEVLRGIAEALVEENRNRARPCILLFDQVYWAITSHDRKHVNPCALVPECAPYVIHVDAISKWMCATGLRVGWAVLPPHLQNKMKAFLGHVGAWAPRAEQVATAELLRDTESLDQWFTDLNSRISGRLDQLYAGILALREQGLPVHAIAPQGGIYLSFRVNLVGKGFDSNEDIRRWLLEQAGVAVVPFQAFDMDDDSGWFRMSVGAVEAADIAGALARLEAALRALA